MNYKVRIKSGSEAGRWVGAGFGGGLVTNPEVQLHPPVNVPGIAGLWAQERAAAIYFNTSAAGDVQAKLKALGYETELVEVK
ncbi:MAG TPA: hypothetical protein VMF66_05440 [Candidatus Acidoferrum sp.]|nr:hypothetical protein [Candidatus Acidoferrum sp.]